LLFTTPGIEELVSGVILYDETIRQSSREGVAFPRLLAAKGINPGGKVDTGTTALSFAYGEIITEGLDGTTWSGAHPERHGGVGF
jgi:fructose-bisphosphate aldolase class I